MTTRDRLIQTAQDLLWERGYVAMSPRDIQERSGAGQGSMYHHFKGKADLASAAIERSAASFRTGVERYLAGAGTPTERIRNYMLRPRKILRGCQIGKLTQDPEIASNTELRRPIDETFAWLRGRLQELLDEAKIAGELRSETNTEDAAAMLVAAIQGGYVLASAAGSTKPFHQAVRGALAGLR